MADPDNKSDANSEPAAGKAESSQKSRASDQSAGGARSPTPAASNPQAGAGQDQATPGAAATDAIALLKADHRRVEALFADYEQVGDDRKDDLIEQVCAELVIHTLLEEEIFYPACRKAAADEDSLDEAQVEHDSAKLLIGDLMRHDRADRFRDAKVRVLSEQIKHHVGEEEAPADGIFAKAQAAGVNTPELGQQLQARREQLQAQAGEMPWPRPVSIQWRTQVPDGQQQEQSMARQQEDNGRSRGRSTRDDDDDRRNGSRSSARGRDDDDRRESSRSSSRSRDDDDRPGWYGDPEGHAEAARRGWEERRGETRSFARSRDDDDDRGGRSRSRDDDDDRGYRSRGREDDDRRESSRSSSRGRDDDRPGWSGDPEGHSQAARRGWEERREEGRDRYRDDDRPGWFGDPEGHAEASRRGWEERRAEGRDRNRDDDDDRRNGSRARSREYDDRGGSRGRSSGERGQGGWFGDSRGHSEAARRGQEERR